MSELNRSKIKIYFIGSGKIICGVFKKKNKINKFIWKF